MKFTAIMDGSLGEGSFDLDELHDAIDRLVIKVSNEHGDQATLTFDQHLAYRCRDEGDGSRTLAQINASGGLGHNIYKVDESEFLNWFESERGYQDPVLQHYCICTTNWIIDVIALAPPTTAPTVPTS